MKKYKIYFYIFAVLLSLGIVFVSTELYSNRNIKYDEVLVKPEK